MKVIKIAVLDNKADFPPVSDWKFYKLDENTMNVRSYVEYRDSLGNYRQRKFQVRFSADGKHVKNCVINGEEINVDCPTRSFLND